MRAPSPRLFTSLRRRGRSEAAVGTAFALTPRTDAVRFVTVSPAVVVVLLAVAVLGALGARRGAPWALAAAAAVSGGTGLLQLAQAGRGD